MAEKTRYCRCQKLPHHLQNLHFIRYTFVTVSNIALFHKKTQSNDQNRKRRQGVPCLWDISEGKKAVFGWLKFKKLFGEHKFKVHNC